MMRTAVQYIVYIQDIQPDRCAHQMDTMQPEEVKENILEEFFLKLSPEGGLNVLVEVSKTKRSITKVTRNCFFYYKFPECNL